VYPGAYVEPEPAHRLHDRTCAANRACRPVERCEEPVARGIDLDPVEVRKLTPDERVVPLDEISPRPVTELGRFGRRTDDVCEEHRRKDSVGLSTWPDARQELFDLGEGSGPGRR
jgi:hypothetical protein